MKIGDILRKIRKANDISVEDMATQLGINYGSYSRIERDEVGLTIERLFDVAKALNVDVVEIIHSLISCRPPFYQLTIVAFIKFKSINGCHFFMQ